MFLVLESGEVFQGHSIGRADEAMGELAFTTAMTGYQETITDPSYAGQIVVMSTPVVGAYDPVPGADQAEKPALAGLVVREAATGAFTNYLKERHVVGLEVPETRTLVKIIRTRGALRAGVFRSPEEARQRLLSHPKITEQSLIEGVSTDRVVEMGPQSPRVAIYDAGVKRGIVHALLDRGLGVALFPPTAPPAALLETGPGAVLFSNGPGNPEMVRSLIAAAKGLMGRIPLFGICLGHQILALAGGARIKKMPFGHRGANHPVGETATGRVLITTQNHGFVVQKDLPAGLEITHISLFDGTVEGLRLPGGFVSVQFHPEARPGPREPGDFFALIERAVAGQPSPGL